MKKVTVFIGSQRKKATYEAVQEFEKNLKSNTEVEFEYVLLKDYNIGFCKGCCLCFNKGEEFCPLKDDMSLLIEKMNNSDGVIFATPNYAFQVSAMMKNLLDRLAFSLHRPRFFGKACTSIVVQGIYGGGPIVKYLDGVAGMLGFNVSKGSCITILDPVTPKAAEKRSIEMKKTSERFYKKLIQTEMPAPSFYRLMMFRVSRTSIKLMQDDTFKDFRYFTEKGWFKSEYYYEVHLGLLKNLGGKFFDFVGKRMSKQ